LNFDIQRETTLLESTGIIRLAVRLLVKSIRRIRQELKRNTPCQSRSWMHFPDKKKGRPAALLILISPTADEKKEKLFVYLC